MTRKVFTRDEIPNFLIVCEGTETEPLYFKGFHIGYVVDVTVTGVGKSNINLVKDAIKLMAKEEYDQVWVVFDIDECTPGQFNEAINLSRRNNIKVAYSNRAIEIWFLLHFHFHDTSLDRGQYMDKLSKLLGVKYQKNSPDLYIRLLRLQGDAIRNAKHLYSLYTSLSHPCQNDPCTTVFQLVEELNHFSRDSRTSQP